jgi:hypothetical protein
MQISAPNAAWFSVASSADGSRLAAAASRFSGPIYISTDSGATWISNNVSKQAWTSIASSADGNTLAAVVNDGSVYVSTNAGATWTTWTETNLMGLPIYRQWVSVAASADGTKLVAAYSSTFGGIIYGSTNSGATWEKINTNAETWQVVASSANGNELVAGCANKIFTTTNFGTTWTSSNVANGYIASSADGTKLATVIGDGRIYTSTNSGIAWISNKVAGVSWLRVACSADGNILIATAQNGGIWISQTTPTPQLNITPSSGNLTFSWIVPSTNFVVQQSPDLKNWTNSAITPTLNLINLQEQVVLSPTNSSGFYRLKTP